MRLDDIPAGSAVTFSIRENEPEEAFFMGISGSGKERTAKFVSKVFDGGSCFDWEAYRYNGFWALGSSADRMKIIDYTEVL